MKPVLQALLIADRIYQDTVTGKKVVAGIFHQILFISKEKMQAEASQHGANTLPVIPGGYQTGSPFAYISLTDVKPGRQPFVARYVDLSSDNVLFQVDFHVTVQDPLQIVELVLPLPSLPAIAPGAFAFELLWNDEPLGSYRIIVKEGDLGGSG